MVNLVSGLLNPVVLRITLRATLGRKRALVFTRLGNLLSGHSLTRARPGMQGARYATSGTGAPALGQAPRK